MAVVVHPFTPEKAADLKRRFYAAIERCWVITEEGGGEAQPCNVFDYEDGMRLIVSYESHRIPISSVGDVIHLSMSYAAGSPMSERYERACVTLSEGEEGCDGAQQILAKFIHEGAERFRRLSDYQGDIMVAGVMESGVPHLFIEAADWKAAGLSLPEAPNV